MKKVKNLKIVVAVLIGFSLSYIPNNYMSEGYEKIAFYIVIALAIIYFLWNVIIKNKKL